MKTGIEVKGFEIRVNGEDLEHCINGELVAITENFTNKKSYMTKENLVAVVYHSKTDLAEGKSGIVVEDTEFNELVNIKEDIKEAIDEYFSNLDNVKLGKLGNGSYYIKEENEELKNLNKNYYNKIEEAWLENNKKHIVKTKDEWIKNKAGKMEKVREYEFKKENIEQIDERRNEKSEARVESEKRYADLYELAQTDISEEDFEDVTGLPKEHFKEDLKC